MNPLTRAFCTSLMSFALYTLPAITLVALVLVPTDEVAADTSEDMLDFAPLGTCNAARCNGRIKYLFVHGSFSGGYVKIKPEGDVAQLDCTPQGGVHIVLLESNHKYQELYSLLLSSTMADRTVNLRIRVDSDPCALVYAVITNP